jgi:ribosomal protein S18 acetylase RimI-like enzyme
MRFKTGQAAQETPSHIPMLINSVTPQERAHLLGIATRTGLFSEEEAESLLGGVLDGLKATELPEGHQAFSCRKEADGAAVGWCYFAPDDHAAGVWNLWWIGVDPTEHGSKAGRAILAHVEESVIRAGGRLLVIETSDSEALARARRFYTRAGYKDCGHIPHFYAENEAKVIFARCLPGAA